MWRFGILLIVTLIHAESKESENVEDSELLGGIGGRVGNALAMLLVLQASIGYGERDFAGDYNVTGNYSQVNTDEREDYSGERIGATVTQIFKHPYAASLLKNDSYVCSAVILNTYWLLTLSKCFETSIITSYVTHRHLNNYTVRTGSSYNNKGGSISKIKMLINNFDIKVSAIKLTAPLVFSFKVDAVRLPSPDGVESLGSLATMLAWMPNMHLRAVNAPIISPTICEPSAPWTSGRYICMGGVQDPNRHFCRKDNGGAVIQNNTLIGISSFLHTCALYTKIHAFPKVSTFARWLDTVIWDENNRPTTTNTPSTSQTTQLVQNTTEPTEDNLFMDPRKFMVTLPFDAVNVPLEPAGDNSVIPRMSLYESYLQSLTKAKLSTTLAPIVLDDEKKEWLRKFGKTFLMASRNQLKNDELFDYN